MPIIDVHVVVPEAATLPAALASSLADALGRVLAAAPGHAWLRLHTLDAGCYAENDCLLGDQDLPVFVTVLHARWPPADALARQAEALARAVAAVLGRDAQRVHVEFAPAGAGRVAFGGRLLPPG